MVIIQNESLPPFFFGCRRLGHGIKDFHECPMEVKELADDDLPYSVALKAKSNVVGKECLQFGSFSKKSTTERSYVGKEDEVFGVDKKSGSANPTKSCATKIQQGEEKSKEKKLCWKKKLAIGGMILGMCISKIPQLKEVIWINGAIMKEKSQNEEKGASHESGADPMEDRVQWPEKGSRKRIASGGLDGESMVDWAMGKRKLEEGTEEEFRPVNYSEEGRKKRQNMSRRIQIT